jgi:hypothetical protein
MVQRESAKDRTRSNGEVMPTDSTAGTNHGGKYRALWAWLREREVRRLNLKFGEVEEIIGMPLPPSSRKSSRHWRSYTGSAVVRAIHDAGWKVEHLDLSAETVILAREP